MMSQLSQMFLVCILVLMFAVQLRIPKYKENRRNRLMKQRKPMPVVQTIIPIERKRYMSTGTDLEKFKRVMTQYGDYLEGKYRVAA